jgi:hypothetical protein
MVKLVSSFALVLSLAACAAPYKPAPAIRADQVKAFKQGVTTEGNVIAALGRPTTTISGSDGTKTLSYASVKLPEVSLFTPRTGMEMTSATFTFDSAGLLLSSQHSETVIDSGQAGQRP